MRQTRARGQHISAGEPDADLPGFVNDPSPVAVERVERGHIRPRSLRVTQSLKNLRHSFNGLSLFLGPVIAGNQKLQLPVAISLGSQLPCIRRKRELDCFPYQFNLVQESALSR